jgi:sulfite reductase alpha subunit-like flavoprotein
MTPAAVQLPDTLTSRGFVGHLLRRAIPAGTRDVAVGAGDVVEVTFPAADELVRTLLGLGVEQVVLVNPPRELQDLVKRALDSRARPERSFLLTVQHRADAAVYRA